MRKQSILLERLIHAPVSRVFRAWTDPRDLDRFAWGSIGRDVRAQVDRRVGGAFVISTAAKDGARWSFVGAYVDIVPKKRIAHTLAWDAPMGYPPADENVAVEFVAAGRNTKVVFHHEGKFSAAARDEHKRGWADVLDTLKRFLESERTRPDAARN
jgi:uncharacterized protein YndB with AHSA1/START domain